MNKYRISIGTNQEPTNQAPRDQPETNQGPVAKHSVGERWWRDRRKRVNQKLQLTVGLGRHQHMVVITQYGPVVRHRPPAHKHDLPTQAPEYPDGLSSLAGAEVLPDSGAD